MVVSVGLVKKLAKTWRLEENSLLRNYADFALTPSLVNAFCMYDDIVMIDDKEVMYDTNML